MARADIAQPLNGYFLRKDTVITIFLKKNSDLIHGFKKKRKKCIGTNLADNGGSVRVIYTGSLLYISVRMEGTIINPHLL